MNTAPEDGFRTAWLGLGGNIGDPVRSMSAALQAFANHPDCRVTAVSRLYRTPPWGKTDQDWFFNACAGIKTRLAPLELLDLCLATERALKRIRADRWGPRTIDIDVLFMEGVELHHDRLTLPHPRMMERAFVLTPLSEIAPGAVVAGRTIVDWARSVDNAGIKVASENGEWWKEAAKPLD